MVQAYSCTDSTTVLKNSFFNLSKRSDFYMIDNLSTAVPALPMNLVTSLSVDEILLPRYVNGSIDFRGLPFDVDITPFYLKHINSALSAFT